LCDLSFFFSISTQNTHRFDPSYLCPQHIFQRSRRCSRHGGKRPSQCRCCYAPPHSIPQHEQFCHAIIRMVCMNLNESDCVPEMVLSDEWLCIRCGNYFSQSNARHVRSKHERDRETKMLVSFLYAWREQTAGSGLPFRQDFLHAACRSPNPSHLPSWWGKELWHSTDFALELLLESRLICIY
jgi:hypothetical protein